MSCPFCLSSVNKVVDKRGVKGSGQIRRRRECLKCRQRFTTYESRAEIELVVIKKDGRRQPYDRDKLVSGIVKALEKSPYFDQVELIASRIENKLRLSGAREIQSKVIGRAVLGELKKLDPVAYLRFASVYRQFKDPKDFAKELSSLGTLAK